MHLHEFERYVHQYQDRVFGFACYFLGSREDAKDVTQDVLIRLWRHRDDVDTTRLLPWLMRVTRNACIDQKRRRSRHYEVNGKDLEVYTDESDDSPADRLQSAEGLRMLEEAIEQIPEPYHSVIILREIQNMKYEEISGAMDMPLNTVKVYIHRARKMLREQLSEVFDNDHVR